MIVGVVAGLSVPKIADVINQTKVQRAAQAIQSELQQAFAIAGRNRAPVVLRWSTSSLQLQITNLAGTVVYRRANLGSNAYGFSSSEVSMTPSALTVFPTGLAADTLQIRLTRTRHTRTIRMSRAGMVRLQ